MRLFISLAIHNKRILKSGDFKQAFCQATLPPKESYVLKPSHGCPRSKPGEYWLLKRSLYGLKRSAKHRFNEATIILKSIGLQPLQNAPCLFQGKILKDKAPLYLGLYVDSFIYFSTDPNVERAFEQQLQSQTNVDFMGNVSHVLGHKFQKRNYHTDNTSHLKVHVSQTAYADQIIAEANLTNSNPTDIPYRSGYPVDAVPDNPSHSTPNPTLQHEI